MKAGLAALADHPMDLGLAVVGSAALRAGVELPLLTDFFVHGARPGWHSRLRLPGGRDAGRLDRPLLVSRRAAAPLVALGLVYGIAGLLSGAPDAPVFAGFGSALVVLTAVAGATQSAAITTAETTALRRSPVGT